jgi:hypothetical protein
VVPSPRLIRGLRGDFARAILAPTFSSLSSSSISLATVTPRLVMRRSRPKLASFSKFWLRFSLLLTLFQPHTWPSAVLVDELQAPIGGAIPQAWRPKTSYVTDGPCRSARRQFGPFVSFEGLSI